MQATTASGRVLCNLRKAPLDSSRHYPYHNLAIWHRFGFGVEGPLLSISKSPNLAIPNALNAHAVAS
jgi:hypothetical protein